MTRLSHVSRRTLLAGAAATGLAGIASPVLAKAPMANAQAPSFYRFKLGAFELTAVSDGPLQMAAEHLHRHHQGPDGEGAGR
jgi:hypothetical protein